MSRKIKTNYLEQAFFPGKKWNVLSLKAIIVCVHNAHHHHPKKALVNDFGLYTQDGHFVGN